MVNQTKTASGTALRTGISSALCIAIPVVIWFAPIAASPTARHALAIAAFMIVAWVTEILPHALSGLLGCYLFWVLGVVPFSSAFSGFADQTPWFLFGAGLLGVMATKSGIARRLAYGAIRRTGASYSRILLGLILTSFLLTFLVPSGLACVAIMASVGLGLTEILGIQRGSNFGRGIFITLTYTAGIFDKMVLAGASSILGRGMIEKATHMPVYWSLWLFAFLPCALLTILFTWRLIVWLYPPEKVAPERALAFLQDELRKMGALSRAEKKTLVLMLLAMALWVTDLLHHIPPAAIGIGAGLLAAVPGVGILDREDLKRVNYLPVFFVAAAISMSDVLVNTSALSTVTTGMFGWMAPWITNPYAVATVPYWTAFAYHLFLGNEISMLAASLPALLRFAGSHGLSPLQLGLIWSFASGGKVFVYQSGVMVMGYSYGYFEARDLFRVGLCMTVLESILLAVMVPFYWPLIGIR
jgi:solute carrier family 13 (sodium-dependent dicarboxylate transporter), member 2/3/5